MKKYAIALFACLLFCFSAHALADEMITFIALEGEFHEDYARSVGELVNAFRTGEDTWYWNSDDTTKTVLTDLNPLIYDEGLERIAMRRAVELAINYAHVRPDGTRGYEMINSGARGENIACGYTTAEGVYTAWREDDDPYAGQGHRRNMLSASYNYIGVGCYSANGYMYWVQLFSRTAQTSYTTDYHLPISIALKPDALHGLSFPNDGSFYAGDRVPWEDQLLTVIGVYSFHRIHGTFSNISYASSDESILSTASNLLTGVAPGETTLFAQLGNVTFDIPVKVVEYGATGDLSLYISGDLIAGANVHIRIEGPDGFSRYYLGAAEYGDIVDSLYGRSDNPLTFNPTTYLNASSSKYGRYTIEVNMYEDLDVYGIISICLHPKNEIMTLPAHTARIEREAFAGIAAGRVVIPIGCKSIDAYAFRNCKNLKSVRIPSSVTSIAGSAFSGCLLETIEAVRGSAGARYAQQNGIDLIWIDE